MLGYKHAAEAIAKNEKKISKKINHPMYNKKHIFQVLKTKNKLDNLNSMYNKLYTIEIRKKNYLFP